MWKFSIGHGGVETQEDVRANWTNLWEDSLKFRFVEIGTRSRGKDKNSFLNADQFGNSTDVEFACLLSDRWPVETV